MKWAEAHVTDSSSANASRWRTHKDTIAAKRLVDNERTCMTKSVWSICGLFACLGVLLSAQPASLTVSPSNVTYRLRSPRVYPTWRFIAPAKRVLEVAAAPGQAWTVQIDGPLTSACLYFSACFQVTEEYSNTPISSGVGPQRVAVNWYGSQGPNLDPGNYGASISFVPQGGDPAFAVQVNLEVVSASTLPATSEAKATALWERGCVPTDPVLSYTFAVRCDIPDEAPVADPAITLPAVGQVFIDPTFGGKITRVTGPGCETEYGTTTAFSKQNTYLLTSCGVFRIADNSLVRAPRDNIGFTSMSATDDEVYYHLLGTEIRR